MAIPSFLPRWARWTALIGLIFVLPAGLWYAFLRPDPSSDIPTPDADQPVVFKSPFRNVELGVQYVGDAVCASCHLEVAKSFHAHPMGQSADWMHLSHPIEGYDEAAKSAFTAHGFDFRVKKKGDRVLHLISAKNADGGALPEYVTSADIAIGSGEHGRTYLSIEKGSIWQSPISWYSRAGRWDVSPIHELDDGGRRPIVPDCLYCHTNRVESVRGAINRYREPVFAGQVAIGCERCHGPGELHVAERRDGHVPAGIDLAIVNPRHLSNDLKTDICRQCHLQGLSRITRCGKDQFDYRPGLPWDQFVSTFIMRPNMADYSKSVGQFEQMEVSKCYLESGGKLGCVSCHDPHAKPDPKDTAAFFRNRCLTCHESNGCSAPSADRLEKADSCIGCHMPKKQSSNVVHVSLTDHRIPRRLGSDFKKSGNSGSGIPLVPYPPGPYAPPLAERDRDWGIAASNAVRAVPQARAMWSIAEKKLLEAIAKRPTDDEAWIALSTVRMIGGNRQGAEEAAREAVRLNPKSESALSRLAAEARNSGDITTAISAANALITMNPTSVPHLLARAEIYVRQRDWIKAETDARAALAIHPLNGKARLYLAVCIHHRGDPLRAVEEAATAIKLIPTARLREDYMRWFQEQVKAPVGK
jgi:Tfp pilus assembly protein PilF